MMSKPQERQIAKRMSQKMEEQNRHEEVLENIKVDVQRMGIEKVMELKEERRAHLEKMRERHMRLSCSKKINEGAGGELSPQRPRRTSFLSPKKKTPATPQNHKRRSDIMKSALMALDTPLASPRTPKRHSVATPIATPMKETPVQATPGHSKETLRKKLRKVEQLQKDILADKGEKAGRGQKSYRKYESKRLSYVAALEELEEDKQGSVTENARGKAKLIADLPFGDEQEEKVEEPAGPSEHDKSLDRQFRRQVEIEDLKGIYKRLSAQRMEAEEAARRAAAANAALGEESSDDWSDFENDDDANEEEEKEEEQQTPLRTPRYSYNTLKLTLRELDQLQLVSPGILDNKDGVAHSSFKKLEQQRCEVAAELEKTEEWQMEQSQTLVVPEME